MLNNKLNVIPRLTAFVVRSFNQANALPDFDIDENVVLKSLSWLAGVQTRDGGFPEVGKVSHKAMQGGNGKGLALTAYVAIAFLETEVREARLCLLPTHNTYSV